MELESRNRHDRRQLAAHNHLYPEGPKGHSADITRGPIERRLYHASFPLLQAIGEASLRSLWSSQLQSNGLNRRRPQLARGGRRECGVRRC